MIQIPEFFTSPEYTKTQEELMPMGLGMMKGEIPEYYEDIGLAGGQPFEDLMRMTRRDVSTAVLEDAAKRGVHGGASSLAIGRTMGDIGTKMRWADIQRALKGKQWMFGEGRGITEGVRGAGLTYGGQKSQYGLEKSKLDLKIQEMEDAKKERESSLWSNILSSGIGALGTIGGMAMGQPWLGKLGSAAGGSSNISGNERPSGSNLLSRSFDF